MTQRDFATVMMFLVLIGACSSPTPVDLEGGTLVVSGIILDDATGEPVSDFLVRIIGWDFGKRGVYTVTSAVSDDDGRFRLTERFVTRTECESGGSFFLQVGDQDGVLMGGSESPVVYLEWDGKVLINAHGDRAQGHLLCGETHEAIIRIASLPES